MRRGGYYAAMRGSITHRETAADRAVSVATVRVKLFNLLLPELGPDFLRRGLILPSSALAEFVSGKSPSFWQGCHAAFLDGTPVGAVTLQSGAPFPSGGMSCLTVRFKVADDPLAPSPS